MRCCGWIVCVLAALTILMNAPALTRLLRSGCRMATSWQLGYRGTGEPVDAARRMASLARANGKSIAYCRLWPEGLLPIERSRLLAMSWETAPCPVRSGSLQEVVGVDSIVAAEYEPVVAREMMSRGYRVCASGGGVDMWCRGDGWEIHLTQTEQRWGLEGLAVAALFVFALCCHAARGCEGVAVGLTGLSIATFVAGGLLGYTVPGLPLLLAVLVVICLLAWKRRLKSCRCGGSGTTSFNVTGQQVWALGGLAAIYMALALSHTFVAPNGLGTVGGKARLMFLSGGFPDGFFTNPVYAVFQPAYPPGAASLVLWCNTLVGACGEWVIQLLPCLVMVVIAGFLMSRLGSTLGVVALLVAFTTPVSIRLATLFYPEVYVALCCVIGWERIRRDRLDAVGWWAMGASGWFKNEGLVYFCSVAASVLMMTPRGEARRLMVRVALAAVLPVTWHLGCRLVGTSLEGFLPIGQIRISQLMAALRRAYHYMFVSAWHYAFVYPLSTLTWFAPRWRSRNLAILLISVLFSVIGFAVVFSLSDAPDFEWHLDSLERLLWTPSLLLLRETMGLWRQSGECNCAVAEL